MKIPMSSAGYCCDCDAIVDRIDVCPACGSKSLLCLAKVMNREVKG